MGLNFFGFKIDYSSTPCWGRGKLYNSSVSHGFHLRLLTSLTPFGVEKFSIITHNLIIIFAKLSCLTVGQKTDHFAEKEIKVN
jgi:hypothetical protein